jgi:hypothetical protein
MTIYPKYSLAGAWLLLFLLTGFPFPKAEAQDLGKITWQPLYQGVDFFQTTLDAPRPMVIYALRIDLQQPGVAIITTPGNPDQPGTTLGLKTSTFLKETDCQVAINAAHFAPVINLERQPQRVTAAHVSDGQIVASHQNSPALLIDAQGRASVARPPINLEGIQQAVGGFSIVLENGTNRGGNDPTHPRTAAGVGEEGRLLYLLIVDGRQPGISEGATTRELGALFLQLGADQAINLDGGGTTTLVFGDANGEPRIINRPIHAGIPGWERVSASHLGVRAKPLQR